MAKKGGQGTAGEQVGVTVVNRLCEAHETITGRKLQPDQARAAWLAVRGAVERTKSARTLPFIYLAALEHILGGLKPHQLAEQLVDLVGEDEAVRLIKAASEQA